MYSRFQMREVDSPSIFIKNRMQSNVEKDYEIVRYRNLSLFLFFIVYSIMNQYIT